MSIEFLLVIEEYVGALDVAVKEVSLVAVLESLEQLLHEGGDVQLVERHQAGLQDAH